MGCISLSNAMSFQINDKVVCVDDSPLNHPELFEHEGGFVQKGIVYVVEGGDPHRNFIRNGKIIGTGGIYIVGKPAFYKPWGTLVPWRASRFRKLADMKAESASRKSRTESQPQGV